MKRWVWVAVCGIMWQGVTWSVACSGPRQTGAPPSVKGVDYPEWVVKGSGAYGDEHARYFYGVGSVSGIRNTALARTTADNRARAEIAKIFEAYASALMKDYAASMPVEPSVSSDEQNIDQAIKTFSAGTLAGVQVVDHWYHPTDGSVFSLAKLDLETFKDNLGRMHELSDRVREYARQNADRAHQHLEGEQKQTRSSAP